MTEKEVTIVYDENWVEGEFMTWVIALYENADDADRDFPDNYKEKKTLRTKSRT